MKRLSLVALLALALPLSTSNLLAQAPAATKPPKPPAAGRTIEINGGDDMKYSVTEIAAKPGETIRVVLKSTGTLPKLAMAHNFVLLKSTANPVEFNNAAAMARDTDFIPAAKKADVIASTTLVGPGEAAEVTFKVPAAAGKYPFMCSFPGHFTAGMKGTLIVK